MNKANLPLSLSALALLAPFFISCDSATSSGDQASEPYSKHSKVPQTKKEPMGTADLKISGPYTHENLSIFLVHGPNEIDAEILTLEEAIEQKKIIVHETENVNELAVENIAMRREIFIQAGDIVKGGKQDRVLGIDLILEPKSGKVPIASFCVEQGRWAARGNESLQQFSGSKFSAATGGIKKAVRLSKNQSAV